MEPTNLPPSTLPQQNREERNWALAIPISAIGSALFGGHAMLLPILLPLVIWLIKKETSPLCDAVGKETLNAQISYLIYILVCIPFCLIIIGFFGIFAILILDIVCSIIAAVKASEGVVYRYPLIIRFIK